MMTEAKEPAEKPLRMTSIPFILMTTEAVIQSVGNKLCDFKLVTTTLSICTCVVVSAVVSKSTEMTWHWGDRTSKVETQNFGRIVALRTTSLSPSDHEPTWLLQDATFEKMGVIMAENNGRLLAMYDELSAFLTKIKLYGNRGLSDSHELAMFLELYNANPWTRTTGMY